MSLESVDYKLKDNEIMLLDSLNIEYFDCVMQENEKYARYKTYDTTQPLHSINYVNNERLNDLLKPIDDIDEKLVQVKHRQRKRRNYFYVVFYCQVFLEKKVTGKLKQCFQKSI